MVLFEIKMFYLLFQSEVPGKLAFYYISRYLVALLERFTYHNNNEAYTKFLGHLSLTGCHVEEVWRTIFKITKLFIF